MSGNPWRFDYVANIESKPCVKKCTMSGARLVSRPYVSCKTGQAFLCYDQETGASIFTAPLCEACEPKTPVTDEETNARLLLDGLQEQCDEAGIDEIPFAAMMALYAERRKRARSEEQDEEK